MLVRALAVITGVAMSMLLLVTAAPAAQAQTYTAKCALRYSEVSVDCTWEDLHHSRGALATYSNGSERLCIRDTDADGRSAVVKVYSGDDAIQQWARKGYGTEVCIDRSGFFKNGVMYHMRACIGHWDGGERNIVDCGRQVDMWG